MNLTFLEKEALKDVLRTFESCVEYDESNKNYVDGGNFTFAMDEETYSNFKSGLKKFAEFTKSDMAAFKKRQSNCEHKYTMLDNYAMCFKCGFEPHPVRQ